MRAMRRGGRRRASLGGLFSDIMDATHDYTDDWIERLDDFEYDMRDAFDDVVEDRDYWHDQARGRGPSGRPMAARGAVSDGARMEAAKKALEDAGLRELADKVERLSKTVEKLAKKG
jgi:hypothetical protein